jgi:integrase
MGFSPKGVRIMPKLNNRPPKYSKMGKYAVVYYGGKMHYLGRYGSDESKIAYSRLIAEIQANPLAIPLTNGEKQRVTIRELTAAFLDHAKANINPTDYTHYRTVVLDFLDKLYGDNTPVENFTPRSLKLVRDEMIKSRRFCRNIINKYARFIIFIFGWGVENELVQETTWRALKSVKSLAKGHEGTFDHDEREAVSDDVVIRTLPFMPPTLRTMVQLQRILGMRPSEIFRMRVGDIDTTRGNGLWYYVPGSYKTSRFVGKIVFPLGKPEQELIAPYLEGKTPEAAVFSPRTAIAERNAEKRANRKTKISPSQAARDAERAANPREYKEFYTQPAYRQAIEYAIAKGNRQLPSDEQIPHWYPYQLRHSASTATELAHSDEDAQALLGHRTVNMTKRYTHTQLARREALARNRKNPFESEES